MVKISYNGLRIDGTKKLLKAHITYDFNTRLRKKVITIYMKEDNIQFKKTLRKIFTVINDTDSQIDYFETDKIILEKGDKYYKDSLKACIKFKERNINQYKRRLNKILSLSMEDYYQNCISNLEMQIKEIQEVIKQDD